MTCRIIKDNNDYYRIRNQVLKEKYGERYQKGMHLYTVCKNKRCVNPDHMVAKIYAFEDIGLKPCTVCGKWLPPDKFYADSGGIDGYSQKCMTCKTS